MSVDLGVKGGVIHAWPRLRVLRLLPALDYGGVESRVILQAKLHARDELDLRVCTFDVPGAAASTIRESGVPVDVLGVSPSVRNRGAPLALGRYLRAVRPDIVHASIVEANFHALAVAPFAGVPVNIVEETGMPSHGLPARLAFSFLYRQATAIVGVTEAVCDYVRRVDGAPSERVELIYNCAHPNFFPEVRRSPTQYPPKRLLAIGRLVPVKNHQLLLEAFAILTREHQDAELAIAGDGPLRSELEGKAANLGISRNVRFLGYQSEVRELLGSCRAFVLPSLSEGCSISLIEAMASGVLVVGSRVAGIREVMGEALASQWTAPTDDVQTWARLLAKALVLSEEERVATAEKAQERAYSMFAPTSYVRRVEALYKRLTSTPSHEPPRPTG